jgi:hypothetical protein
MRPHALAILAATFVGCAPYRRVPVDPRVDFAAHVVRGGLLVDRMRGDGSVALARVPRWPGPHDRPTFIVRRGGAAREGIWLRGPGRAVVRASQRPDAPVVGRVEPTWTDGAIRLRIEPADRPPISTDVFVRTMNGLGPPELTRRIARDDELSGSYRARLRAPDGSVVGWLQVAADTGQPFPVTYEAVLPPNVGEALAIASAAALGKELDWIREHTVDSFPGMVDRP